MNRHFMIGVLAASLASNWTGRAIALDSSDSSCAVAVRLDAVMIGSNTTAAGFPPLLPEPQNPAIYYTKRIESEVTINNSCYICHERGHRLVSDYWEYDPVTGTGPFRTLWSGTVSYHAETNGATTYDCSATRTGPYDWSDPACGFGTSSPDQILVSNRTAFSSTLVLGKEEHGLATSPLGTARRDISERSRFSVDVYDPYSLADFVAAAEEGVRAAPWPDWTRAGRNGWAERGGRNVVTWIDEDRAEFNAAFTKLKYRIAVRGPKDEQRLVTWLERFTPNGGGPLQDTPFSERITCTGDEQYLVAAGGEAGREVLPPSNPGRIEVLLLSQWSCDDESCAPGSGKVSTGSIDVNISLGKTANGESAGLLALKADAPALDLASPQRLQYFVNHGVEIIQDGAQLRQIKAPQTLAVLGPLAAGFEIRFYPATIGKDRNGYYLPSGPPQALWQIEQPDDDPARVRVTRITGGTPLISEFSWSAADDAWALVIGNLRKEIRSRTEGDGFRTETFIIRGMDDAPVRQEIRRWRQAGGLLGDLLIFEQRGGPDDSLTTTWSYYEDPLDRARLGRLKTVTQPGGARQSYEYDEMGRLRRLTSPFASVPQGRALEYSYEPVDPQDAGTRETNSPRLIVEKVLGAEVSRTYWSYRPEATLEIRAHRAAAPFDDSNNLVTVHRTFSLAAGGDIVESVELPDGTLQFRASAEARPDHPRSIVIIAGQPNTDRSDVIDGTRTETLVDTAGRILSRQITDIKSGTALAREMYSYPDAFGRADRVTYLDGTSIAAVQACCQPWRTLDLAGTTITYAYDPLGRLSALTRDGITEAYDYDAAGQIVQVTRRGTNGTSLILRQSLFDLAGREIQSLDGASNITLMQFQSPAGGGSVRLTTYPDGGMRREEFALDGSLLQVSGEAARPLAYEYGVEEVGDSTQVVVREVVRNAQGLATGEWTKVYTDFLGRPARILRSDGGARELTYNAAGQLRKVRDFDGRVTLYAYNQRGEREYRALDVDDSDAIELDGMDRVVRTVREVVQGRVRTQVYIWPQIGRDEPLLAATWDASIDGRATSESHFGLVSTTRIEPMGQGVERRVEQTPDGSTTAREFIHGRLRRLTRTGSAGEALARLEHHYDAHGRLERIVDQGSGLTKTLQYDNADRVVRIITQDADGSLPLTTDLRYDGAGRVLEVTYPDGARQTNSYTPAGDLLRTTGDRDYPVDYQYDDQGRLLAEITRSAAGFGQTRWEYDPAGGWVGARVWPDGQRVSFERGPGSVLERSTSARGIATSYSYTSAGDLSALSYSSDGDDVLFQQFDRLGQPARVQCGDRTTALAYHPSGQWQTESADGLEVQRTFDAMARPSGVIVRPTTTGTAIHQQALAYDGASRIASIQSGPVQIKFQYGDNCSKLVEVSCEFEGAPRLHESRTYDGFGRIRHSGSAPANAPALVFDYQYDHAGRQTNVAEASESSWTFRYDAKGQLIGGRKRWNDGAAVGGQQFEYDYDPAGNRIQVRCGGDTDGGGLRLARYTVNPLNQYQRRDQPGALDVAGVAPPEALAWVNGRAASRHRAFFHLPLPVDVTRGPNDVSVTAEARLQNNRRSARGRRLLPGTPESFRYDADGNLTRDGLWTLEYDAENRLIRMEALPEVPAPARRRLEFQYDHRGRRRTKTVWRWDEAAGDFTLFSELHFVYHEWQLLAELNETNGLVRRYIWGPDRNGTWDSARGLGAPVAMMQSGHAFFYAHDGHGNIRGVVDAEDGKLVAQYDYGPFGELLRATGPMARQNPFRFAAQYQDDETDFLYFGERYYVPSLGRWLSRDPLGEAAGPNLYAYAANNPNHAIDPLGLDVVYLLDPNALNVMGHPSGHAGVLIGNDRTGWHYFSFTPGKCMFNPYGGNRADNLDYRGFNTLAQARQDPALARYLKYARWQTDSAADRKALEAARTFFNKRYNICTQTCDDLAAQALLAAGVTFDDRWRPVDSYDANKDKADESGTFPQPIKPHAK